MNELKSNNYLSEFRGLNERVDDLYRATRLMFFATIIFHIIGWIVLAGLLARSGQ